MLQKNIKDKKLNLNLKKSKKKKKKIEKRKKEKYDNTVSLNAETTANLFEDLEL